MTPSARVQAAIEILDEVIASAIGDGPPADTIVQRYFKTRRYAGSKDRRAVRELVYRAIRRSGERPDSGRSAMLGVADEDEELSALFDGSAHGPAQRGVETGAPAALLPSWIEPELSELVTSDEWPALLERAPLDLRINVARTDRETMAGQFEGAEPTRLSPWGLRLPPDTRVDDDPAFAGGLVEVQDEGSQLIALACQPSEELDMLDLCAGAGGKSLALAAAAPASRIIASDTNRARLAQLGPRAERAGATIAVRLLDGGREAEVADDQQRGEDHEHPGHEEPIAPRRAPEELGQPDDEQRSGREPGPEDPVDEEERLDLHRWLRPLRARARGCRSGRSRPSRR